MGTEPELSPRQRITSVPLAIRAEVAETADAAKTADRLTAAMTTSTITDDANKLVPSGAVILWTGSTCPAGYTRLSALDGAMIKGGASYSPPVAQTTAELAAHMHNGPSHTHVMNAHKHGIKTDEDDWVDGRGSGGAFIGYNAIQNETASMQATGSGSTSSTGSGTVATLLFCRKN